MTKDQIKAELIRSACEDKYPWGDVSEIAFSAAEEMKIGKDSTMLCMPSNDLRIFFLLVAEAL